MSWFGPYLRLMQSTAQGINNQQMAFQNSDVGFGLINKAFDLATSPAAQANPLAAMSSPDMFQLAQSGKTMEMNNIKYGALQKAYDAQRESAKKAMDKEFEMSSKLNMLA